MLKNTCPCGSPLPYEDCCAPYISGQKHAPTVETLVRSRYTAFCLHEFAYLVETTHPDFREDLSVETIAEGTERVKWLRLDLGESSVSQRENGEEFEQISFAAYYEQDGVPHQLSETSFFKREDDRLYYVDGVTHKPSAYKRTTPKCGRNDPCPCGSGKKYKKCCGATA
ncbi:MAG: YchJ family protein [Desulfovibrionaceae bacterium]